MFDKFKEMIKKQNEKSMGYMEKAQEKNNATIDNVRAKADRFINTLLTTEGYEKAKAKASLMPLTLAYPVYKVDYVGGHPSQPQGKEDIKVMVIPQGLVLSNVDDVILFEEIKNISFKSETEIQKDVTLTRMIAFGVYALALKKKKKVVSNFLILECEKGELVYSIAFGGDNPKVSSLYSEVFKRNSK